MKQLPLLYSDFQKLVRVCFHPNNVSDWKEIVRRTHQIANEKGMSVEDAVQTLGLSENAGFSLNNPETREQLVCVMMEYPYEK